MAQESPERNPETTQRYKRETWWQVVFPVLVVTILLVIFMLLIFPLFGFAGASVMADYSVLFIFALVTMFWVGGIAVVGGLIYALAKALEIIPPNTYKAQKALVTARDVTDKYTDQMAQAIIEQKARAAAVSVVLDTLQREETKQKRRSRDSKPIPSDPDQPVIIIRGKINE